MGMNLTSGKDRILRFNYCEFYLLIRSWPNYNGEMINIHCLVVSANNANNETKIKDIRILQVFYLFLNSKLVKLVLSLSYEGTIFIYFPKTLLKFYGTILYNL
ncbi:unnamed protein product [Rhizophagus irregularis]|nr:unnamed protein product [Rhizophagus irregularis]